MTIRLMALVALVALAVFAGDPSVTDQLGEAVEHEFKANVDGTVQRYVEQLPEAFDSQQPTDLLIALHGHGSDRWQYIRDNRGECQGARDVAARHGMIYVSPDYRARTSWMGPSAEADLVQLIDLLREKYNVRRVFLVGGSMGGTSALIFTALHPELINGVSAQNGTANMIEYDQFQDAIAASYGGSKRQQPDEYRRRSPELFPEKFKMPVAMTIGAEDEVVPPDSCRRLARRLKQLGNTNVLLLEDAAGGHSTSYEATVQAIEFVIQAAATKSE